MLDPDEVSGLNTSWLVDYAESPSSPRSGSSPGALYLMRVRDDVLRQWRQDPGYVDTNDVAKTAISRNAIEMWQEFVDLEAWEETAYGDLDEAARAALTNIGERLGDRLVEELNEWNDDQDSDDEDEEDTLVHAGAASVADDEW